MTTGARRGGGAAMNCHTGRNGRVERGHELGGAYDIRVPRYTFFRKKTKNPNSKLGGSVVLYYRLEESHQQERSSLSPSTSPPVTIFSTLHCYGILGGGLHSYTVYSI